MDKPQHIAYVSALAVALGVGMAVANTPAVASADPTDSRKGSSSSDSSPSNSSRQSGSTSSDAPSAKKAPEGTNDAPRRHRRPQNPRDETAVRSSGATTGSSGSALTTAAVSPSTSASSTGRAGKRATPEFLGPNARQHGGDTPRPWSGSLPSKTGQKPLGVNSATADPTVRDSSPDFTRVVASDVASFASTPSDAALPPTPPASVDITATPADPVSRIVSTLVNVVVSPFANGAPATPVEPPTALTLLAVARREFDQTIPSTTVNPPAGHITNGLVTDTVSSTSEDVSATPDPGFISSTRSFFGLFSITSAGDPDDNNYVAVVFETPIFAMVLTSGTDPEDNLGFGAASIGVAGHTVFTFISPLVTFSAAIPIEDPFAELFIALIRAGIV